MRRRRQTTTKRRYVRHWKRQRGVFLNRYDFAYVGRDIANQAVKIAPGICKNASWEINNIAQQWINQAISQGGQEIERFLPNILRGAIESVYQTPVRLLEKFGK